MYTLTMLSYFQHALIRNTMYTKFKELRDILILKAYEIQGIDIYMYLFYLFFKK